jgi:SWI/SNF-related matrix-associated actin-dependent regulator of chromatin subfamily A3
MSASEMQKYDIIITTYQTVAGEYEEISGNQNKKRKSDRALFEVAWKVSFISILDIDYR